MQLKIAGLELCAKATPMDNRPTSLERAFELAKSGQCATVEEIKKRLKAEGHWDNQIVGMTLIKQLRELIEAAKKG